MLLMLTAGLLSGGTGLYLLACTERASQGIEGIAIVVALITLGVFLTVPAKIYIIVRFTRDYRRSRKG